MATHPGFDPSLGGERRAIPLTGAEPQLGGDRRVDLPLLDVLSRGMWAPLAELRRVIRHIPQSQRSAYCDALLARLAVADPSERLPEVNPWRGGRDQRVRIINSLSLLGDPRVGMALSRLVPDSNAEVRHAAITALGVLRDPYAVPVLSDVVAGTKHSIQDRVAAADALAEIGGTEAMLGLVAGLQTGPTLVRRKIVIAIAVLAGDSARSALIGVMRDDEDASVRAEAAHAVGRLHDLRALLYLWEALDDPAIEVRQAAVSSIGRFHGEIARAALNYALSDANPDVRQRAAGLLQARRK